MSKQRNNKRPLTPPKPNGNTPGDAPVEFEADGFRVAGFQTDFIHWYPGHIAKWDREMSQWLRQADVVVEVRDARLPSVSAHPRFQAQLRHKPRLLLLNKADLADPLETDRWIRALGQQQPGVKVLPCSAKQPGWKAKGLNAILTLGATRVAKQQQEGLRAAPVRVLVLGMPNVGKSSVINTLVGTRKAITGHRAGVTRHPQWIKASQEVMILDSPGLLPPRIPSQEHAYLLASVDAVGEAAYQEELVAEFLLKVLLGRYPDVLTKKFPPLADLPTHHVERLPVLANGWGNILPGGEPDIKRTAQQCLKQFYSGDLGRFTLEAAPAAATPPDNDTP